MVDPLTFVTPRSWSERDAVAVNTPASSITVLPIWLTETVYMHYTLSGLLLLSGSSLFFCWILSFLPTLHTSWPSELAPSFPSASHSFSFLRDAFEPICLKCSSLLGRLVGGPGCLCCCPSLAWWHGYKGRRGFLSLLLSFSRPSCFLQIPLIFTSAPTREASCYRCDAAAAPAVLDLPAVKLFQAFGIGFTNVSIWSVFNLIS